MFKKYKVRVGSRLQGGPLYVEFYVNSIPTRGGFAHRACAIGWLPAKPGPIDSDKEFKARCLRVRYLNRTWEEWPGQTVLQRLWEQLGKLPHLNWPKKNPFASHEEPRHVCLEEADSLFDPFERRC